MRGTIPPLPQYVFMARFLVKHRGKFIFTYTLPSFLSCVSYCPSLPGFYFLLSLFLSSLKCIPSLAAFFSAVSFKITDLLFLPLWSDSFRGWVYGLPVKPNGTCPSAVACFSNLWNVLHTRVTKSPSRGQQLHIIYLPYYIHLYIHTYIHTFHGSVSL